MQKTTTEPRTAQPSAPAVRPRRPWRRLAIGVAVACMTLIGIWLALVLFVRVPKPNEIASAQSTVVLDAKGRPIGRIHSSADRVIIPFDAMPPNLRNAVIAAEDHGFYSHHGFSPLGILRAAFDDALHHRIREGGSTITQQYVKNAFVGSRRTLWRKIKEVAIAIKIDRTRSKKQVLADYLNTIYFGRGAYGVEAASRTYYGKPASALTLDQAAMLAGIIRAPEALDPSRNPKGATRRRDEVLHSMASLGMISDVDATAATARKVVVVPRGSLSTGEAPYALEDVRIKLIARFGSSAVYRGGLRVTTTIDLDGQRAAERAIATTLDRPDDPAAALVAVDPRSGAVRALVGGRDYTKSQYDIATHPPGRQPGSSFKPFVLAAWLDAGHSLDDTFRAPASITLGSWHVSNYDRRDYGSLTVLQATEHSVNTVYAQMITRLGPEAVKTMAERAGITSPLEAVPSLTLGTNDVTPLDLAGAYATFAGAGTHPPVHMISSVTDPSGHVLYRFSEPGLHAVDSRLAGAVTSALRGVMTDGTGRSAQIGRPAAGKTGTTENHRDAWFAGYTPDLATVVWMGYPDGIRTMQNVHGIAVVGASFPAQIWREYMRAALANISAHDFPATAPLPETTSSFGAKPTSTPSAPPPAPIPPPPPTTAPAQHESTTPTPSPSSPSPSPSASSGSPTPTKPKNG